MVSWATAGSAPARRNTVTSRITMDSLVLMVFLPEYVNVPVLLFLLLPVQWHGRYVPNGGEEETCLITKGSRYQGRDGGDGNRGRTR
jgi:hypothetical protein